MDRQKYAWNQDYRDGYDEGAKDGREQMKNQIEYARNEIEKILSFLKNIESENEE